MSRRDTRQNPLSLFLCLKNNSKVPWSLLKNGKRSARYLESSRQSLSQSSQSSQTSSPSSPSLERMSSQMNPSESGPLPPPSQAPPTIQPNDSFRFLLLMKDINLLRNDVEVLKQEVFRLHWEQSTTAIDSCHVKVFFPNSNTLVLEPAAVSNLLGCPSMQVTKISSRLKSLNPASTRPCNLHTPPLT